MPIIIDGHNLLHSIRKAEEDFEPVNDIQLCQILDKYLKLTGQKGQIVFDGTGPPDKSPFDNIRNLEVIFAGRDADADTIIENQIKMNTAPKSLTAVSSDRRLKKAARTRKVTLVKSDAFWKNLQKRLSRKRPPKEPPQKRTGLTESETNQWLEFFDLEQ